MRKLVLMLTVAFMATNAAGCIISSGDDDDGGEVIADVGWVFKNIADNRETGCPGGFDTVKVIALETDSAGVVIDPEPYVDLLDCVDGIAANRVSYDPGFYNIFLEVRQGENGPLYAQSLSEFFDLNVADDTFDYIIFNDGGYFDLAWDLRDAQNNAPLSCADAGSGKVEITATVSGQSEGASLKFNCQDGGGVTDGILEGDYVVSIAALNQGETAAVGVAPAINTRVPPQNGVTALGTVVIPID